MTAKNFTRKRRERGARRVMIPFIDGSYTDPYIIFSTEIVEVKLYHWTWHNGTHLHSKVLEDRGRNHLWDQWQPCLSRENLSQKTQKPKNQNIPLNCFHLSKVVLRFSLMTSLERRLLDILEPVVFKHIQFWQEWTDKCHSCISSKNS